MVWCFDFFFGCFLLSINLIMEDLLDNRSNNVFCQVSYAFKKQYANYASTFQSTFAARVGLMLFNDNWSQ